VNNVQKPDVNPASHARTSESGATEGARAAEVETLVAERTSELSELASWLQNSVENERSALAKELHDELGGLITAAKMDMAWLQAHIGASLDAASDEKFRSVVQMLNQAMTMKRRVVESLRPSLLDHFGLPVALRSHLDENCGRAGLDYVATLPEETLDLAPATQLVLFRVAQEVLARVLARGKAKHIELVIEAEGEGYSMLVGDDGPVEDDMQRAHFGMRHRVQGAGGTFEAESVPGHGNRVRVYVPRSPAKSG
jgi:signal transduction histidine kinase